MKKYFVFIICVVLFSGILTAQGFRFSGNGKMILERTVVVHDNHKKATQINAMPVENLSPHSLMQTSSSSAEGMIGINRSSLFKAMALNMSPYTPSGWSSPIVISNTTTATLESAIDAPTIYNTDNIYVSFAALNNGIDPTPTGLVFYCYIYIDDVLKFEGNYGSSLPSNYIVYWLNKSVGTLSAGTHTFRMEIDPTNVLSESNESDNSYQRSKSISSQTTLPTISSFTPTSGPVGSSVTITGTNFGATQGVGGVTFGTTSSTVITSWTNTLIVATVPNITPGNYTVSVTSVNGTATSSTQFTVTSSVTYSDPIPSLYKTTVSTSVTSSYINYMIERFGTVWIIGDNAFVAKAASITAGSPISWTLSNNGISGSENLYAIDFPSSQNGFIGTESGKIYRTTDGGSSWTLVYNNTLVTNFINLIKFDNISTGIAVGDGLNSTSAMAYLHTTDGGTTWINRNTSLFGATSISQVFHTSSTIGYQAGNYLSGTRTIRGVFRTTNSGQNWSFYTVGNSTTDSTLGVTAIAFQSNTLGVAVKADSTVWKTTNGGSVWRKIGQLPRIGYGVRFTSSDAAFIAGRNGMISQANTTTNVIYSILVDPLVTFFYPEYSSTYKSVLLPAFDQVRVYYTSINPSIPLTTPSLQSPANNTHTTENKISLSWSTVSGATFYDIEIGVAISSLIKGRFYTSTSALLSIGDLSSGSTYQWRVRARSTTNSSAWSPVRSFTTPAAQQISGVVPASFSSSPKASTDYRLITIPSTSAIIVEYYLSGNTPADYRIFEDNGGTPPNHLKELNSSSSLTIGKGYWLVKKNNFAINSTLQLPTPSTTSGIVTISTRTGWNIIGNPFVVPVKWSDIRTTNNLSANAIAYEYKGTSGFQSVDILEPFKGYYYFHTTTTLSFPFPFSITPDQTIQEPSVQFTLAHSSSANTDRFLTIGIDGAALDGMDDFDLRKPPIFTDQAAIWIDKPEWDAKHSRFASDIRPNLGDGQTWNVVVQHPEEEPSRLELENGEDIPDGYKLVFIEKTTGVMLQSDARHGVTIPPRKGTSEYSIIIGKESYIKSQTAQFVPVFYHLHQNYPNPFNPTTAIRFGITNDALVQVKVYDLLGREIATVVNGILMSGNHEYSFDARHLASGMYIYALRAISTFDGRTLYTSSKKMMLIK